MFADAKTSAGAPCWICAASALEPANEYSSLASICGKTFVSDAAAYTVIVGGDAAPAPAAATSSAAVTASSVRRITAPPSQRST